MCMCRYTCLWRLNIDICGIPRWLSVLFFDQSCHWSLISHISALTSQLAPGTSLIPAFWALEVSAGWSLIRCVCESDLCQNTDPQAYRASALHPFYYLSPSLLTRYFPNERIFTRFSTEWQGGNKMSGMVSGMPIHLLAPLHTHQELTAAI